MSPPRQPDDGAQLRHKHDQFSGEHDLDADRVAPIGDGHRNEQERQRDPHGQCCNGSLAAAGAKGRAVERAPFGAAEQPDVDRAQGADHDQARPAGDQGRRIAKVGIRKVGGHPHHRGRQREPADEP